MRYSLLSALSLCCALASNDLQAFDLMELCPSEVKNYLRCSEWVEAEALANNPRVYRQGDALHIQGPAGQDFVVRNTSDPADELQTTHFTYLSYLPDAHAHLLYVLLHEGNAFALVNANTGVIQGVDGYPVMSPNHSYFAVASASLDYNPTVLQIWRINSGDFSLEYSVNPEAWGPGDVVWLDEATLKVPTDGYASYKIALPAEVPKHFHLRLMGQQWTLSPELAQ